MTEKKETKKKLGVGDQAGHWTIAGEKKRQGSGYVFPCRCVCGKEETIAAILLWNGQSTSCGCQSFRLAPSTRPENSISPATQAVLQFISEGRLPPADGWAMQGHEPTWTLRSIAKILGLSQTELMDLLMQGDPRFAMEQV
jgi:hypothetical protein